MAKTKRGLSAAERAERRALDRERLRQAAQELLTSDGWQRWVRARALFHNYSVRNCLLLAAQCHERGIDATRVAGFRTWLRLGRCVRKGEKGLVVLAPIPIKRREDGEEPGRGAGRVPFGVRVRRLADRPAAGRGARADRAAV
jgi:antirestriction factor ArdC-like protein